MAVAEANGGMIDLDDINSGNNRGNTVVVNVGSSPCHAGPSNVSVNGGTVSNETTLHLSADGGVAVSSANGGNGNAAAGGQAGQRRSAGQRWRGRGAGQRWGDLDRRHQLRQQPRQHHRGRSGGGLFGAAANVHINGGTVRNSTSIAISADGGTAVSSANGGDGNAGAAANHGMATRRPATAGSRWPRPTAGR